MDGLYHLQHHRMLVEDLAQEFELDLVFVLRARRLGRHDVGTVSVGGLAKGDLAGGTDWLPRQLTPATHGLDEVGLQRLFLARLANSSRSAQESVGRASFGHCYTSSV
ncbi:hypothetical protein L7A47_02340 [Achromobacter xylosoxidans]|uniref:hypothetical protein n=2 Tax=Alcaligenes xylosoxydans xylosoxydans TaxID=85698 RepID=UPI0012BD0498|nr:hypothetical protein [Achromobacter xylosoxidans]MCH4591114.1 hypothetical protein [Achromobacter xylosoxidans]